MTNYEDDQLGRKFTIVILIIALAAFIAIAATLSSCTAVEEKYVKADRMTFDLMAKWLREYIPKDNSLTDRQKSTRLLVIKTGEHRIEKAEKAHE